MNNLIKIACFMVILGFVTLTPISGFTHILKVDRSIGINLHINPDDDPIAGQNATFFPDLRDKDNKFDINDCQCSVKITKNDELQFSKFLNNDQSSNSNNLPVFNYTFPDKGVYSIEFTGKSYSGNFQDFNIVFDTRIERQPTNSALPIDLHSHTSLAEYLIFAGGFIFILGVAIFQKIRQKTTK